MKIYHFKKITSTNDKAKELIKSKERIRKRIKEEDIVAAVVAEEQTKGRGRFKRRWASGKGGIYLSIILKPKHIDKISYLTFIAAIAAQKAVEDVCGLRAYIKWPNDLHINGKKLCGILTEPVFGKERHVIVGIGLNVNNNIPSGLNDIATTVKKETGRKTDKSKIINNLLKKFGNLYQAYSAKKFTFILKEWKQRSDMIGMNVLVKTLTQNYKGSILDVDKDCNLILKLKNKKQVKIVEGDINFLNFNLKN